MVSLPRRSKYETDGLLRTQQFHRAASGTSTARTQTPQCRRASSSTAAAATKSAAERCQRAGCSFACPRFSRLLSLPSRLHSPLLCLYGQWN
ncbi:unnamed protein product [Hydatigera taeniaeformis]|uniref:Uncharacterized protein n=1 Tax=Hydatigena taeniaeformis TaxID=6205 RepID=A0A0R3WXI7_HYDTA|nr:unnamed protein product [Hydatigera taeniaeformis]